MHESGDRLTRSGARWFVATGVLIVVASASLWALRSDDAAIATSIDAPNPAAQRLEMIQSLRSIDQRLNAIHGTLKEIAKKLPDPESK